MKKSLFAQTFEGMVIASGKTHGEFARSIGVSQASISRWLNDQVFPRPHHIKAAVAFVKGLEKPETDAAVEAFCGVAALPLKKATPLFNSKMGPNIVCYVFFPCLRRLFLERIPKVSRERSWKEVSTIQEEIHGLLLRILPK